MGLRGYQSETKQKLRASLAKGNKRVVCYLPTGSGKSVIATDIADSAVAKGKRVAFIANRKVLVNQIQTHFQRHGIDFGVLQADNTRRLDAQVIACSIDTVHTRGLCDIGLMIIDECHSAPGSKKYRELLFKQNNVPVVGLSATPFSRGMARHYDELDGRLFEDLIVGATIAELQEDGFLVRLEAYAPVKPDLSGVKTKTDAYGERDYVEADLEAAMDRGDLIGDIVAHWFSITPWTKTVCFACSIAHSKHIVEQFRAAGVPAIHMDCYMKDEEREQILHDYALGKYMVISCVSLLAEGFDDPATETMILARPTKSLIRYIQMVGRIIRPYDGKTRATLVDHTGTVLRLGFPDDPLPLVLDDGKPRQSALKKEEEALPKECPKCHFLKPAKVRECPKCHFKPERQSEVIHIDGKLSKVERKKAPTLAQKERFYRELLFVAYEKGYKHGWAWNQYLTKFKGEKPSNAWRGMIEASPETRAWVTSRMIRFAKGKQKGAHHAAA